MNKSNIVKKLATELEIPQTLAKDIVVSILVELLLALAREKKVTLTGFGCFTMKRLPQRIRRNPRTGQNILVPEYVTVRFKPSRKMKEHVVTLINPSTRQKSKK